MLRGACGDGVAEPEDHLDVAALADEYPVDELDDHHALEALGVTVARQGLLPGLRANVIQLGRFPLDAGLFALQLLQPGVDGPDELGVLGLVDDARRVVGVHAQPQVAVVLGVCGGTSALSAANADVCVMAEDAELFFTAPFTAAAMGDKVANAGSAAAAAKAGVAAIVVPTAEEAAEKAAHIVGLLPANNLTGPAIFEFEQPTSVLSAGAAPEKAAAALIDKDSAVELYAGFGKHVYTAFATIGGNAVGIVATGETLCHNCVAKASRFVRLCDAFSVPVLTIVNTNGFAPSTTDDIAGGIREAARLAATYADATTAKVALLSGKAVGPVYTALANADLKIAVNGCTVSALEPNAAVSVLYKAEIDASDNIIAATNAKAAQYTAEVCSAANAVAAGAADMTCDAANARASVVAAFELLSTKRAARLPKKHGNMAL